MEHRPILRDAVVALAFVQTGKVPGIWPRPLPDAATARLLDVLEPILCSIEDLSAHERLSLAAAFDAARQLPAIKAEPLTIIHPRTRQERKLRWNGLMLTQQFGAGLGRLDARISAYADEVRQADLEECVAALSSSSELGIRLRLRPGSSNGDSVASLLTISRRPSLEALMDTVAGLGDATLQCLASYAPHCAWRGSETRMESLAQLHSIVTNAAHRQARHPWRSYDLPDLAADGHPALSSPVPSGAVLGAVGRWLQLSDPRRWVGVHPLVSAAILHAEFIRLRPFELGNGRVGRVLFQAQLYAAGLPVVPWHVAFEWHHDDYLMALADTLKARSYEPILKFVLEAGAVAVAKGNDMVPALKQERKRLMTALSTAPELGLEDVRLYAESALSSLLLEGFWSGRGIQNCRPALKRLHEAGVIDRIRTPIGAVYSSACCRQLMRTDVDIRRAAGERACARSRRPTG